MRRFPEGDVKEVQRLTEALNQAAERAAIVVGRCPVEEDTLRPLQRSRHNIFSFLWRSLPALKIG